MAGIWLLQPGWRDWHHPKRKKKGKKPGRMQQVLCLAGAVFSTGSPAPVPWLWAGGTAEVTFAAWASLEFLLVGREGSLRLCSIQGKLSHAVDFPGHSLVFFNSLQTRSAVRSSGKPWALPMRSSASGQTAPAQVGASDSCTAQRHSRFFLSFSIVISVITLSFSLWEWWNPAGEQIKPPGLYPAFPDFWVPLEQFWVVTEVGWNAQRGINPVLGMLGREKKPEK